jgi:hypothetical protein
VTGVDVWREFMRNNDEDFGPVTDCRIEKREALWLFPVARSHAVDVRGIHEIIALDGLDGLIQVATDTVTYSSFVRVRRLR